MGRHTGIPKVVAVVEVVDQAELVEVEVVTSRNIH